MVNKALKAILDTCPQFRKEEAEKLVKETPLDYVLKMLAHPDKDHFKPAIRAEIEALAVVAKYWTWK